MTCKVNDTVMYGAEGVCRFAGVLEKEVRGSCNQYYVLRPVYNEYSTIFVPVNNERLTSKMRRVLSADEIYALIKTMPDENTIWIEDETVRKEQYKKILSGGERTQLVRLIKTLHQRQQAQKEKGRKMHAVDERFMRDAEKMLYDEFAHVLNISHEQVLPLILEQIRVEETRRM